MSDQKAWSRCTLEGRGAQVGLSRRPALAEKRVALVIGNSAYKNLPKTDESSQRRRLGRRDAQERLAAALVAILGRCDVHVSAEDSVEMALIGKSTQ